MVRAVAMLETMEGRGSDSMYRVYYGPEFRAEVEEYEVVGPIVRNTTHGGCM